RRRVFCFSILRTKTTNEKDKKGVRGNHPHILLAAFTSFTREKKRSTPLLGMTLDSSNCSPILF
ncbi:hypothetical protein, partial [Enterococcus casseliflavus]|uniref:hypothetical protein n=1 Tax=Enterococcus casseliflavus TaxID=37734 RepID=UPI003D136606